MNNAHRGLIYHTDIIGTLKIGDVVPGYIRTIRPDGKLDLALGQAGHRRIGPMSEKVIEVLTARGGKLPYHDNSLPEEIREVFGMSKKAFKQAIGALFKEQRIHIDPAGIRFWIRKRRINRINRRDAGHAGEPITGTQKKRRPKGGKPRLSLSEVRSAVCPPSAVVW